MSKKRKRPRTKGCILWVDDDPMMIRPYVEALRDEGYTVTIAKTLEKSVKLLQGKAQYALAILDIMIPIMSEEEKLLFPEAMGGLGSGLALARWIRNNSPTLRFIAFTAEPDGSHRDWFDSYGAGYATKVELRHPKTFLRFVKRVIEKRSAAENLKSFIVHGHDDAAKLALKNFLQNNMNLAQPVVLHEQPSSGRTILEKFEQESEDVDVVFVLLTPDDKAFSGESGNNERRRARQNVIFELGYFLGRLGRSSGRVILLHEGVLEIPTDISGLVYISIDQGIEAAGEGLRRELAHLL